MRNVEGYLDLITGYHRRRPRYRATVAASVAPAVAGGAVLAGMPAAYDLDYAVGTQLDVDGLWIGYSRNVTYVLPHDWFSFDDPARGWDSGRWKIPEDPKLGLIRLDDDDYRQLLRAKALFNRWDGLATTANAILATFLNNPATHAFVQDNHDGTQFVGVSGLIPALRYLVMLDQGYLAVRPAGVTSTTYVTSVNEAPLFGFDVQNEKIAGWDDGAWGVGPRYLVDYGYAIRRTYKPTFRRPIRPEPPLFGFDLDDARISGFDFGVWRAEGQRPDEYGHDAQPIYAATFIPSLAGPKPPPIPAFGFDRGDAFVHGFDFGAWVL